MEHEERVRLARYISDRLVAGQPGFHGPNEVVISAIYGSTARGTDSPWSDLEMFFVSRSGSPFQGGHDMLLYRGIPVGIMVYEQEALEHDLVTPRWEWWGHLMGILDSMRVLHGKPAQVRAWVRLGQSVPTAKFRESLEANLPWIVRESLNRVKSCHARGNDRDIGNAVVEMLSDMGEALCLLNQGWTTHSMTTYQGFVDTFNFPKLPEGYRDLVPMLWSAREMDQIVVLAETLANNFWQQLADEGLRLPTDYHKMEELPLFREEDLR